MRLSRTLLKILRLAHEVAEKIPQSTDSFLGASLKTLAIVDSVQRAYLGKESLMEEFRKSYQLEKMDSDLFVSLFFKTGISDLYPTKRWGVAENSDVVEIKTPDGERIFFQSWDGNPPEHSSDFYYTKGFNFEEITQQAWKLFPNGIYLGRAPQKETPGGHVATFTQLAPCTEILSPEGEARVQEYRDIEAPSILLAAGDPGTGKSLFSRKLSEQRGARFLKIDAPPLSAMTVPELDFMLRVLRPGVVVIDDFDRVNFTETASRVLHLFEQLHNTLPVLVVLTVNDTTQLDEALLRSGRIDEIVDFTLPGLDERAWILTEFLPQLSGEDFDQWVLRTEGLSQANLVAFCKKAKTRSPEKAFAIVQRLHDASKQSQKRGGSKDEGEETYLRVAERFPSGREVERDVEFAKKQMRKMTQRMKRRPIRR